MFERYYKKILDARVYDVAIESPIDEARLLGKRYNNTILLKREDLQPVFSFKLRGAYNKMAQLSKEQLAKGSDCSFCRQPCPGSGIGSAQAGGKSHYCYAQNHTAD